MKFKGCRSVVVVVIYWQDKTSKKYKKNNMKEETVHLVQNLKNIMLLCLYT